MTIPWLIVAVDLGLCLLLVWLVSKIYYRITHTHLEVRLFGVCLRRIELTDIKRITKNPQGAGEQWVNTIFNFHKRRLVILRRSGIFKNFIISPKHRYAFKAELKKRIALRWEEVLGAKPEEPPELEMALDDEENG